MASEKCSCYQEIVFKHQKQFETLRLCFLKNCVSKLSSHIRFLLATKKNSTQLRIKIYSAVGILLKRLLNDQSTFV